MVSVCGLNHMTTYGTYLAPYIQAAKKDPAILKLLQEMRTVSYDGVPISVADDDWCFENGIPMIVSTFYVASLGWFCSETIKGHVCRNRNGYVFSIFNTLSTEEDYSLVQVALCQPSPENLRGLFAPYQASHAGSIRSRTPLYRSTPILPNCSNSSYSPTLHKSPHCISYRLTETSIQATCSRSSPTDHISTVAGTTTGSKAMIQIVPMQSLYYWPCNAEGNCLISSFSFTEPSKRKYTTCVVI
jgi:hypothetical protein